MTRKTLAALLALALFARFAPAGEGTDAQPVSGNPAKGAPSVEVVFVLDTTGSMGGLIEGAKRKIWSIAEAILTGKPAPEVRVGLVAYRDKRDAYVTKVFDLSDDMDKVYENLRSFGAGGGGDGPEHVNRALTEAVTEISWSGEEETLRLLFLVGDAPPHTDYKDGYDYKKAVKMAVEKDIFVNTIQCGSYAGTKEFWTEIAESGNGKYAAIMQSGGMRVVSTPYDGEIATISRTLGRTAVAYGGGKAREEARRKGELLADMDAGALAARAGYAAKAAARPCAEPAASARAHGFGEWDLVAAVEAGRVKLNEVDREKLPEEMKEMSAGEREAFVEKRLAERGELKKKLAELSRKRDAFVKKDLARTKGKVDSFDGKVLDMLRAEAAEKGIEYKTAD